MPTPSPSMVPSALASKGRQSPCLLSAVVFAKHSNMNGSFMVSAPPQMATSACPSASSFTAMASAPKALAQAASVTQLVPPRSSRFAMRPATTLPSTPGKVLSCQGTYELAMRSQASSTSASLRPISRSALAQIGRCSRLFISPRSFCAPVTPSITLTRSRSIPSMASPKASRSARSATTSASSCVESVAGRMEGGTPHFIGSKAMGSRKPPRST